MREKILKEKKETDDQVTKFVESMFNSKQKVKKLEQAI